MLPVREAELGELMWLYGFLLAFYPIIRQEIS
jgi:hypothetical protein